MPSKRRYRIKEVAELSGLSVRALHHYDAIGLLVPGARTAAGYRLYDDDDLLRLQQILIGRELGLSLEDVRRSLDDPGFDRRRALLDQRAELERRAADTAAMIRAIDAALASIGDTETEDKKMDMKKIFDGFEPDEYADEARERWGDTDAYETSTRRTRSYTEADWKKLRDEQNAIYADAFAALEAGKRPDDPEAMAIAERHRQSIDRWFYPCSAEAHSGLADMYEADRRFADNIDKHGKGLTKFLAASIRANALRTRT
ncbi:MAG: MerR family transcriptional regulator [Sphingomonadales bacterium]|nr:MerR family transcriptional regulator [Sphingomonadales bacterium]